jgi:hypothetical protein
MLKKFEKNVYNWSNRTVQEFAEAIELGQISETKAVVNVTPAASVNLTTTANKTIFNLGAINGNVLPSVNITLGNPGKQAIGDTLIVMLNATGNSVTVCFNATYFYNQSLGSPNTCLPTLNVGERSVTIFTFDGAKFTCTFDNG